MDWQLKQGKLMRVFSFPDFVSALDFLVRIGELAEQQNHHPEIVLSWGKVEVRLWTHTTAGVTEKDEKLARAIDDLAASL